MNPDFEKALALLKESRRILLVPSAYPNRDDIIALVMLALALEQSDKDVTALIARETRQAFREDLPWPKGATDALRASAEFIITLDTARHPIAELWYEQDEAGLSIHLKPAAAMPPAEALSLSPAAGTPPVCVVTVGVTRFEDLAERERLETLFTEASVVTIDADPANEGFGDANILMPRGALAETARSLAEALAPESPAVALWVKAAEPKTLSLPALRLLGRIMARLTPERGLTTSTLTAEDFERSGLSKEEFARGLAEFHFGSALLPKPLAVFWPRSEAIAGLVVADEKRFYRALGQFPGRYTLDGYRLEALQNELEPLRGRLADALTATRA